MLSQHHHDDLRQRLSTVDRCTPGTAEALRNALFGPERNAHKSLPPDETGSNGRGAGKSGPAASKRSTQVTKGASSRRKGGLEICEDGPPPLSDHRKTVLATEAVNLVLRSLSSASAATDRDQAEQKKSNTLKELAPNQGPRVNSAKSAKSTGPNSVQLGVGLAELAECGSVAFEFLALGSSQKGTPSGHNFQLEHGLLAFAIKLISLKLHHVAIGQLSTLRARLPSGHSVRGAIKASQKLEKDFKNFTDRSVAVLLDILIPSEAAPDLVFLAVNYQAAILRLLCSKYTTLLTPAALTRLDPSIEASPVNMARLLLNHAEHRGKANKALEAIAQLLRHIYSLLETADTTKGFRYCEVRVQLQAIACKIRYYLVAAFEKQDDRASAALAPLATSLSSLIKGSPASSKARLDLAKQTVASMPSQARHVQNRDYPYLVDLDAALSLLALDAGSFQESQNYAERVLCNSADQQSSIKQCSWAFRRAAIFLGHVEEYACKKGGGKILNDARARMSGKISGSLPEFEDALQAMHELCWAASRTLKSLSTGAFKPNANNFEDACHALLLSSLSMLIKFREHHMKSRSDMDDNSTGSRTSLLFCKLTKSTIESLLISVRTQLSHGPSKWDAISAPLQTSVKLLSILDSGANSHEKGREGLTEADPLLLKISELCWYSALKAEQSPEKHVHRVRIPSLRLCCQSLQQSSEQAKRMGNLPTKLCKLARAHMDMGNSKETSASVTASIECAISFGVTAEAASMAGSNFAQDLIDDNERFRTLSSALKTFLSTRQESCEDFDQAYYIGDKHLPWGEQAILFEWQMVHLDRFSVSMPKSFLLGIRQAIGRRLLDIYDAARFPIRRQIILAALLQFQKQDPTDGFQREILALSTDTLKGAPDNQTSEDEAFASFQQHLHASLLVRCAIMQQSNAGKAIGSALEIWIMMLSQTNSYEDLAKRVNGPETWLSLLESLADYFDVHQLDRLRLCCLFVILRATRLLADRYPAREGNVLIRISLQFFRMGYSAQAKLFLEQSRPSLARDDRDKTGLLDLTSADLICSLTVGETGACPGHASKLRDHLEELQPGKTSPGSERVHTNDPKQSVARAGALEVLSCFHADHGSAEEAVSSAMESANVLQRLWARFEREQQKPTQDRASPEDQPDIDAESLSEGLSRLYFASDPAGGNSHAAVQTCGPEFWPLVRPLHRVLLWQCRLYKRYGLVQEASAAMRQAERISESVVSDLLLAELIVEKGDTSRLIGDLDEAEALQRLATARYADCEHSKEEVHHHRALGALHHVNAKWSQEIRAYDKAETIVNELTSPSFLSAIHDLQAPKRAPSSPGKPIDREVAVSKSRMTTKRTVEKNRKAPGKIQQGFGTVKSCGSGTISECEASQQLQTLRGNIARLKIDSLLSQGEIRNAASMLSHLAVPPACPEEMVLLQNTRSQCLLQQALDRVNGHAVFGMLTESALSMPATSQARSGSLSGEGLPDGNGSLQKKPPMRKQRAMDSRALTSGQDFSELLMQALKHCSKVLAEGVHGGSVFSLSRSSSISSTISLLLGMSKRNMTKLGNSSWTVAIDLDTPRSITAHRERAYAVANARLKNKCNGTVLDSSQALEASYCLLPSARLKEDLMNAIPEAWSVISISLADDQDHLCIARYRHSESPFILRLPLTRSHAEDLDEETFTFVEARSELRDIISSSDATVHRAKSNEIDMHAKETRASWWEEREALDQRLGNLLRNMQNMWLGGFRGIFAQVQAKPSLLARFQESLNVILDKHLPSRHGTAKRKAEIPRTIFDPRLLELFVSLGDPKEQEDDLEEALTDLLYHVVDILQFGGEGNAYDEIDFDSMIVDTLGAIHAYYEALRSEEGASSKQHIILILDKQLHVFPWESLPSLQDASVSRLPSLLDLRERSLDMRNQTLHLKKTGASLSHGLRVSPKGGTYILNPSGDLTKTQNRFQGPLSTLSRPHVESSSKDEDLWRGLVAQTPTEAFLTTGLTGPHQDSQKDASNNSRKIVLYFGHGSGAQYIRAKTIKHLRPRCNTALLFGCSSASLREAGEFEPYGTPRNYMLAGAPAVAGALWDVTDGDCDRFAAGVLEGWGLLARGSCGGDEGGKSGKGNRRRKQVDACGDREEVVDAESGKMCLSEAVAKARKRCYLKYLNGAAMVVYGVPVYLDGR